jgi:UDPglucose 6-dehydrogenase
MALTVSVLGIGYLGSVHAACMADLGHTVVGVDVDPDKVAALTNGHSPIYEPGLNELLARVLPTGRLRFTTSYAEVADADIHFICVGTPQRRGEAAADVSQVFAAGEAIAPYLRDGALVVGKSTVPVGTAVALRERIQARVGDGVTIRLAWNPEFLQEGHAITDTVSPNRFVYGVDPRTAKADVALLDEVYAVPLQAGMPRIVTDLPTAELVKTAANAFLATKISFINAMSEVCEAAGGDVVALADAIGADERIGRQFLGAGVGFGGGCLPKDIRAFMARAGELGADQALTFLREVDAINFRRRSRMVDLTREECGGSLRGRRVTVLGAAFKPESDDVRDSPALDVALACQASGAHVVVHDPRAVVTAQAAHPTLECTDDLDAALRDAEIVLLLTAWRDYKSLDPAYAADLVKTRTIIDGRNALDVARWRAAGWRYRALGRPTI